MEEVTQPDSKSGAAAQKSFLSPCGDALDSPFSPKFKSTIGCNHSKLTVIIKINMKYKASTVPEQDINHKNDGFVRVQKYSLNVTRLRQKSVHVFTYL